MLAILNAKCSCNADIGIMEDALRCSSRKHHLPWFQRAENALQMLPRDCQGSSRNSNDVNSDVTVPVCRRSKEERDEITTSSKTSFSSNDDYQQQAILTAIPVPPHLSSAAIMLLLPSLDPASIFPLTRPSPHPSWPASPSLPPPRSPP